MTLSRTTPPVLRNPENIAIQQAEKITLSNGLCIYAINAGTDEVVKAEFIFPTGCSDAASWSVAGICHQLIDAGTSTKSALEVAEAFDYFGAYLQTEAGPDWKSISLFSLSRFFDNTLPLVMELLNDAVFPESEIQNWKTRNLQSLQVNREKVAWLSKSHFNATIFGANHPYGFIQDEKFIESVNRDVLRNYYLQNYPIQKAILIVSGKITKEVISCIERCLVASSFADHELQVVPAPATTTPTKIRIPKKDSVQSGIRIGKQLLKKNHPDFLKMSVVNTMLGGYFGSRLMSNIREDKGYTYGIGSALVPFHSGGSFFISTEVGSQVCDDAIKEVFFELNRLIHDPVPESELNLVKNYLIGAFQRSLDGPFSLADRFKGLILHDLDYQYLNNYLSVLSEMTPIEVNQMADLYLQPESMSLVVAG